MVTQSGLEKNSIGDFGVSFLTLRFCFGYDICYLDVGSQTDSPAVNLVALISGGRFGLASDVCVTRSVCRPVPKPEVVDYQGVEIHSASDGSGVGALEEPLIQEADDFQEQIRRAMVTFHVSQGAVDFTAGLFRKVFSRSWQFTGLTLIQ